MYQCPCRYMWMIKFEIERVFMRLGHYLMCEAVW